MTRYTRLGKSTHQRVAGESTSWVDLKTTAPKSKNSRKDRDLKKASDNGSGSSAPKRGFKRKASRGRMEAEEVSANFTELGPRDSEGSSESQNKKVKGFGKSKVVKIFGQFWVPADDAKRLQGLVKKLRTQGLSRKEILTALQSERRKAEKAAKRMRDKTCFGCRQFGHVLSDCPNTSATGGADPSGAESLIEQDTQSGICFKCGTTEHTSRNCKRKGDKFNFAKCFICSKVGHISRQCPNNTKGIYPSGGECNLCKELTHLAKDCPMAITAEKAGPETPLAKSKSAAKEEEANLPVMAKLSNPFASTEYEPDDTFNSTAQVKPKKRKVKF